jgi:hypothetical protein
MPKPTSVPLLEESNWHSWCPLMEAHLAQLGILRLVNGMLVHPVVPSFFEPERNTAGIITKPLFKEEVISNKSERIEYTRTLQVWEEKKEKASGDIMAHLSRSQQVHMAPFMGKAKQMWEALIDIHVQQLPGIRFSTYNTLFSIVKGADKSLPSVATRIEDALSRVRELCPIELIQQDGTKVNFGIEHLDEELAIMAMLRALPRNQYGPFVSELMRKNDLTRADADAAFHVEQEERTASLLILVT